MIVFSSDAQAETSRIEGMAHAVSGQAPIIRAVEVVAWLVATKSVADLFAAPAKRDLFQLEATRLAAVKINENGSFLITLQTALPELLEKSLVLTFGGAHDLRRIDLGSQTDLIWSAILFNTGSVDFELLSRPSSYGPEEQTKIIASRKWYLALDGKSCTEACQSRGSPVIPSSGSDLKPLNSECGDIARAFGSIGSPLLQSNELAIGCAIHSSLLRTYSNPAAAGRPEVAVSGLRRICACE